jgi:ATP-binding protein involved in chromosome partitioning
MAEENPPGMHPSFARVIAQRAQLKEKLGGIRHKIGVYSAKGGVGKTTVAVNLAYSLSGMGFKVGLLDADIDCPNLPMFLGIEERIDTSTVPFKPIIKGGIKVASTAMLVDEARKPIIWRGPMITKMLGEMFEGMDWGELDYLIIDLSPGTSDAPLTIMQLLELDGFVIVTNPQKIAAVNSTKSGLMAKRLNVSLLGVVENMSGGSASVNTSEMLKTLDTELLGTVSSDPSFNSLSDSGRIPVLENDRIRKEFEAIAKRITG